jgi:alkylhydroperoxidase/carboxymuconolactone decarboxylase family protein YurZ
MPLIKEVIIVAESHLKIIEKFGPELFNNVEATQTLVHGDGALSRKVKLLMAMALEASPGTVEEVRSLTRQAKKAVIQKKGST